MNQIFKNIFNSKQFILLRRKLIIIFYHFKERKLIFLFLPVLSQIIYCFINVNKNVPLDYSTYDSLLIRYGRSLLFGIKVYSLAIIYTLIFNIILAILNYAFCIKNIYLNYLQKLAEFLAILRIINGFLTTVPNDLNKVNTMASIMASYMFFISNEKFIIKFMNILNNKIIINSWNNSKEFNIENRLNIFLKEFYPYFVIELCKLLKNMLLSGFLFEVVCTRFNTHFNGDAFTIFIIYKFRTLGIFYCIFAWAVYLSNFIFIYSLLDYIIYKIENF